MYGSDARSTDVRATESPPSAQTPAAATAAASLRRPANPHIVAVGPTAATANEETPAMSSHPLV